MVQAAVGCALTSRMYTAGDDPTAEPDQFTLRTTTCVSTAFGHAATGSTTIARSG